MFLFVVLSSAANQDHEREKKKWRKISNILFDSLYTQSTKTELFCVARTELCFECDKVAMDINLLNTLAKWASVNVILTHIEKRLTTTRIVCWVQTRTISTLRAKTRNRSIIRKLLNWLCMIGLSLPLSFCPSKSMCSPFESMCLSESKIGFCIFVSFAPLCAKKNLFDSLCLGSA